MDAPVITKLDPEIAKLLPPCPYMPPTTREYVDAVHELLNELWEQIV